MRRYCKTEDGVLPKWWLPCYDLSTEFHFFVEEVIKRSSSGDNDTCDSNTWIIKPAQGTRGLGHHILVDHCSRSIIDPSNKSFVNQALYDKKGFIYEGLYDVKDNRIFQMLQEAASIAPLLSIGHLPIPMSSVNSGQPLTGQQVEVSSDRIAQLLVKKPLLVRGIKFDLRVFVFVRSFVPFEGTASCCIASLFHI